MKFRADIQGLRAVAVLSVLLFHVDASRLKGGFIGVDVFYVISGYLITHQILDALRAGRFTLAGFYKRRARRLLPALFATIAFTFAGAFVLFTPALFQQFGRSALAAIFSVSNILFWKEAGYFDTAGHLKPLLHMWSLSVEEQFYLVWPLSIILLRRARWRVLPVLAGAGVISFLAFVLFPFSNSDGFYLMPFRIFQFAAGAMVIRLERYRAPAAAMEALLFSGLALIAWPLHALSADSVFPGVNAIPPTLGAMLVIYAGTAPRLGLVLRNRVMVWIGTISYSLYLVHWPIIVFYGYQNAIMTSKLEKLGLLAASFVAGSLLFYGVEKRFRNKQRPLSLPRLAAFASVLAVLAAFLSASDGWTWRLGEGGRVPEGTAAAAEYGGEQCVPPRCEAGPHDRRVDLYVMGDSHSRAYYAGFAENFPEKRIVFFEASGCPFYSLDYTIYYKKDPEEDRKCRKARAMAFEEIRSAPAPVLVAQNWDPTDMISERTDAFRKSSPNTAAYAEFLGAELRKIHEEIAPELYVMGDVPTTGGRMPPEDCMSRPFFKLECSFAPRSNFALESRAKFNRALESKIGDFATFVDPYTAICDAANCYSILDNKPLYSDNRHLSKVGSVHVVKGLKAQFRELN